MLETGGRGREGGVGGGKREIGKGEGRGEGVGGRKGNVCVCEGGGGGGGSEDQLCSDPSPFAP